jgi:hypothetical protein
MNASVVDRGVLLRRSSVQLQGTKGVLLDLLRFGLIVIVAVIRCVVQR